MTLHVPFRIVKRGGRKEMQLPEGAAQPRRTDNTLVKALARAFRWKRMLESGEFATIAELAEREGIAPSYMTRVLRLTLLAPDIVEAILDGRQGRCRYACATYGPVPDQLDRAEEHLLGHLNTSLHNLTPLLLLLHWAKLAKSGEGIGGESNADPERERREVRLRTVDRSRPSRAGGGGQARADCRRRVGRRGI